MQRTIEINPVERILMGQKKKRKKKWDCSSRNSIKHDIARSKTYRLEETFAEVICLPAKVADCIERAILFCVCIECVYIWREMTRERERLFRDWVFRKIDFLVGLAAHKKKSKKEILEIREQSKEQGLTVFCGGPRKKEKKGREQRTEKNWRRKKPGKREKSPQKRRYISRRTHTQTRSARAKKKKKKKSFTLNTHRSRSREQQFRKTGTYTRAHIVHKYTHRKRKERARAGKF